MQLVHLLTHPIKTLITTRRTLVLNSHFTWQLMTSNTKLNTQCSLSWNVSLKNTWEKTLPHRKTVFIS